MYSVKRGPSAKSSGVPFIEFQKAGISHAVRSETNPTFAHKSDTDTRDSSYVPANHYHYLKTDAKRIIVHNTAKRDMYQQNYAEIGKYFPGFGGDKNRDMLIRQTRVRAERKVHDDS